MKRILVPLIPFLIAQAFIPLVRGELWLTIIITAMLLVTLRIRYERGEWKVMVLGIVVGFIVEVVTFSVYRLQHWDNASLFGVPYWLPIIWGYGFLIIRRVGNMMVREP